MKSCMGPLAVLLVQLIVTAAAPAQSGTPRGTLIARSGVTLGQPVVNAPRPLPQFSDVQPVGYDGKLEVVAPRPWAVTTYDPNNTEFATERPQPRPTPPARTPAVVPAGARIVADSPTIMPVPHTTPAPEDRPIATTSVPVLADPCIVPVPCPPNVVCKPEVQVVEQPCCDPNMAHFYARGEYLLWWVNGYRVPPLVTTSSNPNDFGILNPGSTTRVLFGNDSQDRDAFSGARLTLGYWLDCEHAVEVSGFFLERDDESTLIRGAQFPVLARPFIDLNNNRPFSELTNFPGLTSGDVAISSPFSLWGAEINYRCNQCCWYENTCEGERSYRVDLLAGFRYLDMDERLTIQESGVTSDSALLAENLRNQQFTVTDTFGTRNQFYGGQVGVDAEYRVGKVSFNARGKLALGATHQRIQIDGAQRFVSLDDSQVRNFRGGLLALDGANIGTFTRDRFAFVPEVTLTVGYQVSDHCRFFGGYNFLYWSSVVRPGEQIDLGLDVTKIPNFGQAGAPPLASNRPLVPFKTTDFWAQGVTLGFEFRY